MTKKKVLILGAAGRDFHNFNMVFRDNERYEVVAFTAAQIPNIEGRTYPPSLAGKLYPKGIPILPEEKMEDKWEKYVLKRYLCGILKEKEFFDTTGRIVGSDWWATDEDLRIIWYDMWWLDDKFGRCVLNAKTLIVEEDDWMEVLGNVDKWKIYKQIAEQAKKDKEKYKNCIIVWDRWWPVGDMVFTFDTENWGNIDYWIKSVWNSNVEVRDKWWYVTITKTRVVTAWDYYLQNVIKIMYSCSLLLEQFWYMTIKKSGKSSLMLYKGKWQRKDDAVFAYSNIWALLWYILELRTSKQLKDFAEEMESSVGFDTYQTEVYYDNNYNNDYVYWFNY